MRPRGGARGAGRRHSAALLAALVLLSRAERTATLGANLTAPPGPALTPVYDSAGAAGLLGFGRSIAVAQDVLPVLIATGEEEGGGGLTVAVPYLYCFSLRPDGSWRLDARMRLPSGAPDGDASADVELSHEQLALSAGGRAAVGAMDGSVRIFRYNASCGSVSWAAGGSAPAAGAAEPPLVGFDRGGAALLVVPRSLSVALQSSAEDAPAATLFSLNGTAMVREKDFSLGEAFSGVLQTWGEAAVDVLWHEMAFDGDAAVGTARVTAASDPSLARLFLLKINATDGAAEASPLENATAATPVAPVALLGGAGEPRVAFGALDASDIGVVTVVDGRSGAAAATLRAPDGESSGFGRSLAGGGASGTLYVGAGDRVFALDARNLSLLATIAAEDDDSNFGENIAAFRGVGAVAVGADAFNLGQGQVFVSGADRLTMDSCPPSEAPSAAPSRAPSATEAPSESPSAAEKHSAAPSAAAQAGPADGGGEPSTVTTGYTMGAFTVATVAVVAGASAAVRRLRRRRHRYTPVNGDSGFPADADL